MKNRIKELRLEKGYSQQQLADEAKVSIRTIQRLETGADASSETLNLVAKSLGVSVNELFGNDEQENEKVKAANVLQYQLTRRQEEYSNYNRIYMICYIAIMLIWGAFFPTIHNETASVVLGLLWFFAWAIMIPLKKWLTMNPIDRKLDQKYPLTINHLDKDKK